jgi:hypothetical protein
LSGGSEITKWGPNGAERNARRRRLGGQGASKTRPGERAECRRHVGLKPRAQQSELRDRRPFIPIPTPRGVTERWSTMGFRQPEYHPSPSRGLCFFAYNPELAGASLRALLRRTFGAFRTCTPNSRLRVLLRCAAIVDFDQADAGAVVQPRQQCRVETGRQRRGYARL